MSGEWFMAAAGCGREARGAGCGVRAARGRRRLRALSGSRGP